MITIDVFSNKTFFFFQWIIILVCFRFDGNTEINNFNQSNNKIKSYNEVLKVVMNL